MVITGKLHFKGDFNEKEFIDYCKKRKAEREWIPRILVLTTEQYKQIQQVSYGYFSPEIKNVKIATYNNGCNLFAVEIKD